MSVLVVHINQINVAGDIELACAQFAHADDPQLGATTLLGDGSAIQRIELGQRLLAGMVQRQFSQFGDRSGHHLQGRTLLAIQHHQALDHELAQHTQGCAQFTQSRQQRNQGLLHGVAHRRARGQYGQDISVAPTQTLNQA